MDGGAGNIRGYARGLSLLVALILLGTCAATIAPRADAYIYWARGAGGGVGRANVDGSDVRPQFIGNSRSPSCGVAIDGQHVYWANLFASSLGRANLDGTGVDQNFISAAGRSPCGPAVDGQHVYWATQGGKGSIARADIDGGNVDGSFIPNQFGPCLVAVDSSYLYWSTGVKRASLDGTGVQYIAPDGSGCGVAVDGKHIYWVNHPGGQGNPDAIGQSNLDGTQAHIFVRGAGDVCGLAVDDRYLYWVDSARGYIDRTSLSGQGRPELGFIRTGATHGSCGVAVDQAGPGAARLDLGKTSLNRSRGTAKVKATVDGSGELKLRAKGHGIKRVSHRVRGPDKVTLKVEPRGRKERLLGQRGRVKVEALVKFKSSNGASSTKHRQIKLVRR